MDPVSDALSDAVSGAIEDSRWWGLEFNPAPGDVAAVGSLATDVSRTAVYLRETYEVLHKVQTQEDVWLGDAAKKFTEQLGELPKFLDNAQQSMDQVGKLLTAWRDELDGYQRSARDLEQQAEQAKQAYGAAEQARTQAQGNPALGLVNQSFYTQQEADAAQVQYDAAAKQLRETTQAATDAYAKLAELKTKAQQLLEKCLQREAETALGVGKADDKAPQETFWEWCSDVLDTIGDVAGFIGAVAGALALLASGPLALAILGGIAVGGSLLALGTHASSMLIKGEFDWTTLAGDALGAIPVIGGVSRGVSAVAHAEQSVRTVSGLVTGARTLGRAMHEPTALISKIGQLVTGSAEAGRTVGRISESTIGFLTQVPTAVRWVTGPNPGVDAAETGAGYVALGSSTNSAADTTFPSIKSTIGRLVKAVS